MSHQLCPDCVANQDQLGDPSFSRWVAPDGSGAYCSMHFIRRYGHGERLIPIEGYEPPPEVKAPAPKSPKRTTIRRDEVKS